MGVFFITTNAIGKSGKHIGFLYECGYDDMDAITKALQDRKIIAGSQLFVVDDGRGGRLVRGRKPMALTVNGISNITPPEGKVWEPEPEPAA